MISSKGRYALRVMLDLAVFEQENDGYSPLKDIAERQDLSIKYLEIIMKDMVRHELVVGISGKGGGYRLTKKPEEYNVGDILEKMEGPLAPVACLKDKGFDCPRNNICNTLPMWREYNEMVHNFFYSRQLSDLM